MGKSPEPPLNQTLIRSGGRILQQMGMNMADKQIVFSDQEKMQIEAIVIDKDKEEALKYLARLMQVIKGNPGHACGGVLK